MAILLGSRAVQVRDGVARLEDGGAIAGSTLTLDRAARYAVRQALIDVQDAMRAVTRTPADLLAVPTSGESPRAPGPISLRSTTTCGLSPSCAAAPIGSAP